MARHRHDRDSGRALAGFAWGSGYDYHWIGIDEWRDDALCAQIDPETWFPEKGHSIQGRTARAICAACPVRRECLQDALENDSRFGVWGGLTERDRRPLHQAVNKGADVKDLVVAVLEGRQALRSWAG